MIRICVDHILSFFREENRKRRAGEGVDNKKSYEEGVGERRREKNSPGRKMSGRGQGRERERHE